MREIEPLAACVCVRSRLKKESHVVLRASGSVTFEPFAYDALILHVNRQWMFFFFFAAPVCGFIASQSFFPRCFLFFCVQGVRIVLRVLLGAKSVQRQRSVFSDDSVGGGLII